MVVMSLGCNKRPGEKALGSPVNFVYTRPDAPNIRIPVRSPAANQGGLSDLQKAVLIDTYNKLPISHVGAVNQIVSFRQTRMNRPSAA